MGLALTWPFSDGNSLAMPIRLFLPIAMLGMAWFASCAYGQAGNETNELENTSPHIEYFRSFDTNGDGVISGDEGRELPDSMRKAFFSSMPRTGQITYKFEGIEVPLEAFHDYLEHLSEKQKQDDEHIRNVQKDRDRDRELRRHLLSLLPRKTTPLEEQAQAEEVTLESSPHAAYFKHLDEDGSGVLQGEELESLPGTMNSDWPRMFPTAWVNNQITIREFHTYWEDMKQEREQSLMQSRENSTFTKYRNWYLNDDGTRSPFDKAAPQPKSAPKPKAEAPAVENSKPVPHPAVKKERPIVDVTEPVTFEVVVIRRESKHMPPRTLAVEALEIASGEGTDLAAKLTPWITDAASGGVEIIDYFRARALPDSPVHLQRGRRVPQATSTSSRGNNYQLSNLGTIVTMTPKRNKDGSLLASVQFEKSELLPAAAKEVREENTPKQANNAPAPYNSGDSKPVEPSGMGSITVSHVLKLKAGVPELLGELGDKTEKGFEETVVLVVFHDEPSR